MALRFGGDRSFGKRVAWKREAPMLGFQADDVQLKTAATAGYAHRIKQRMPQKGGTLRYGADLDTSSETILVPSLDIAELDTG